MHSTLGLSSIFATMICYRRRTYDQSQNECETRVRVRRELQGAAERLQSKEDRQGASHASLRPFYMQLTA
jgi:hypothetical protein